MPSNLPFKTWKYEGQTKAKHEVLEDYIDKWIKIVGAYNGLNYIDGHAGIGAYKDEKGTIFYGSPIRVCKKIQTIKFKLDRKISVLIIDEEKDNLDNIKKILSYEKITIKPSFAEHDFNKAINDILDEHKQLAPTFVFVDPFGFKINIETIKKIMSIGKSEVFLNFMFTSINEFLSVSSLEKTYNELFGGEKWKKCKKLNGVEREKCIVEYYRNQLKKFAKYVYYFRFEFPNKKRTYYYLFHLTNYFIGCSIMKSSFAKFHYGRVEYRGRRENQLELFEIDHVKINTAIDVLKRLYAGQQKTFQEIIEEQIDETEFLESHFRSAIKEMENKDLTIKRIPDISKKSGRKRKGLSYNDIIIFNK